MPHIDDATLLAHFTGSLREAEQSRVLHEIDNCQLCSDLALAVAASLTAAHVETPGTMIANRYEVKGELGRGGMGIVYRVYDTLIKREIALKIVGPSDERHAYSSAELTTLGKLIHPSIVRIYDAGEHSGQRFVAMQQVDGLRLRDWIAQRKPSLHAILKVHSTVAEALAYLHGQGVLHRDVKSSNILVDLNDHPWLIDFGLATHREDIEVRNGGTPTHLAPELFDGAAASEASDQFAFFVTLIEALTGVQPFPIPLSRPLHEAAPGRLSSCLPGRAAVSWQRLLPAPVARALAKGVAANPAERYASMADAHAALCQLVASAGRRRLRYVAIVGACAVTAAVLIVTNVSPRATRGLTLSCEPRVGIVTLLKRVIGLQRLAGFSQPATNALIEWFSAVDRSDAFICRDFQAQRIAYAERNTRQRCLRRVIDAWESKLINVDATSLLEDNRDPMHCAFEQSVVAVPAPPDAIAHEVAAVEQTLATIEAKSDSGVSATLLAEHAAAVAQARAFAYPPLLADALLSRARLAQNAGELALASAATEEAVVIATASNDRTTLAAAYTIDIFVQNDLGAAVRTDRAIALARAAAVDLSEQVKVRVELATNVVAIHRGHSRDAVAPLRTLLAQCRSFHPVPLILCIDIHQTLIAALFEAKQFDAVRVELPLLETAITETLGRSNPRYAVFLANQIGLGDFDDSQKLAEAALDILQRSSPQHPKLIPLLQNLGMLANNRGDSQLGLQYTKRALQAARKRFGANSVAAAHLEIAVATSLMNLEDYVAAFELVAHAEQVMSNVAGGAASPFLAGARSMLAELFVERGDNQRAYEVLVPLVASQQRPEVDAAQRGRDEFLLAQLAWTLHRREEAENAARLALRDLEESKAFPKTLLQVKRWLSSPNRR